MSPIGGLLQATVCKCNLMVLSYVTDLSAKYLLSHAEHTQNMCMTQSALGDMCMTQSAPPSANQVVL